MAIAAREKDCYLRTLIAFRPELQQEMLPPTIPYPPPTNLSHRERERERERLLQTIPSVRVQVDLLASLALIEPSHLHPSLSLSLASQLGTTHNTPTHPPLFSCPFTAECFTDALGDLVCTYTQITDRQRETISQSSRCSSAPAYKSDIERVLHNLTCAPHRRDLKSLRSSAHRTHCLSQPRIAMHDRHLYKDLNNLPTALAHASDLHLFHLSLMALQNLD
ncbi:hypothetical protein GOP47_0025170 [Adiantum capillus-veneris]|uniref:Uncharacterized protein n=1 Tax=Adiantum capillus-veneris TaxID=13818 RepID=A0A9D4U462_ADICA|nr:hypothetical protein GOP47_0025170 [Adiantum capillus-veneris]